jgi:hypothetical protein
MYEITSQLRCKRKISILDLLPLLSSSVYASPCLRPVKAARLGGRRPWFDGCSGAGSCFSTSDCCRFSRVVPHRLSGREWRGCMRYDPCSDFAAEVEDSLPARKFVDGRRRDDDRDVLPKARGNNLFKSGLQPGRQPHATPTPLSTDMMMKVVAPYPVHDITQLVSQFMSEFDLQKTSKDTKYRWV